MVLKYKKKIKYYIQGEEKNFEIQVELKQVDDLLKPRQNVYEGFALIDDINYKDPELKNCVNAQYMGEKIINKKINELKKEYGKNFSLTLKKKRKSKKKS